MRQVIHTPVEMIRFTLKCAEGHAFESWFQSNKAFDMLSETGQLTCPECGSATVEKAPMAPRLSSEKTTDPAPKAEPKEPDPRAEAMAELRRKVEENADYVGRRFASEARAMHVGDAPGRSIWGEASVAEAKELLDDGVPVAPVPGQPRRRTN
ncbi:MAG: DUF1178 family protein [Pseudomonadota bacterium]